MTLNKLPRSSKREHKHLLRNNSTFKKVPLSNRDTTINKSEYCTRLSYILFSKTPNTANILTLSIKPINIIKINV